MSHILRFETLYEYDPEDVGISIFEREFGEQLGIEVESGHSVRISTAMGSFTAYGHTLSLDTLGFQLDAMVYFVGMVGFNRNVLGRRGWMEQLRLGLVDYDRKLYLGSYDDQT